MWNISAQQRLFVYQFLYNAYANMEMENEVSGAFDIEQLYQRYKTTIDSLINQWVYHHITFAHEWQNLTSINFNF